ncbi:MAG: hypothetical protein D6737_00475 [Chloroflexi bacterium]|nr:MAG: hypothetical protein CUN54_02855 [Phototrophicales bacterium]RMF82841.1 MAG: hypothetical protein D6737_00475 [Chloroflexota bacterium]
MPKLSVWLVRAALLHMGVGFLFGALILFHKGLPLYNWIWRLLNLHTELMIFGWTMQLVMGVAFFALPRLSGRDNRYGAEQLGWWSFYLLNGGVILTAFGRWFTINILMLSGRFFVLIAVMLYVRMIWPRVKPFGGASASQ